MCGIAGFLNLGLTQREARRLARQLLLEIEYRGKDATGIYTNGTIVKAPVRASIFVKLSIFPKRFGYITLLHTRQATQGTPKNPHNNHPLYSKRWILVHNGIIYSQRLSKYEYIGQVDSEIILSYIERYGLTKALDEIRGTAAIALCKRDNPRSIFLWSNHNPSPVGYIPHKALVFASTESALKDGCRIFGKRLGKFSNVLTFKPETNCLYQITSRGIREIGDYGFYYYDYRYDYGYRSGFKTKTKGSTVYLY